MNFKLIIPLLFIFCIDIYFFQIFRTLSGDLATKTRTIVQIGYWLFSIFTMAMVIVSLTDDLVNSGTRNILFSIILITVISKLVGVFFLALEDIGRLGMYVVNLLQGNEYNLSGRREAISKIGLTLSSIPFITLLYGMVGRVFKMTTKEVNVWIPKLPKGWDGAVIAQISDLHVGSLSSPELIEKAAEIINNRKPDIMVFTGDLVNSKTSEANGFVEALASIKSNLGKFSILGNHDYGFYENWATKQDEKKNMEDMYLIHKKSGFDLLLNENRTLKRNGDEISLIGVENWGASRHFPKVGDLKKSMVGVNPLNAKVLLSHDPTHWEKHVTPDTDIDLTLSGHTHGFQFGIDIPGFVKWSPVQYVYKHWSGLYEKAGQFLYVNRGLGFLGYMGRVGMTPEVTFLTLRSGTA